MCYFLSMSDGWSIKYNNFLKDENIIHFGRENNPNLGVLFRGCFKVKG